MITRPASPVGMPSRARASWWLVASAMAPKIVPPRKPPNRAMKMPMDPKARLRMAGGATLAKSSRKGAVVIDTNAWATTRTGTVSQTDGR